MPLENYWTSGTSDGLLSADHPMWCATKQIVNNTRLSNRFNMLFRYLALQLNQKAIDCKLVHQSYENKNIVICENK